MSEYKTPFWQTTGGVVLAVTIVLMLITAVASFAFRDRSGASQPRPTEEVARDNARDGWRECQDEVSSRLKNPAGAQFPPLSGSGVREYSPTEFGFVAYVDATNSFGAVVRTAFACKAKKIGVGWITDVVFAD